MDSFELLVPEVIYLKKVRVTGSYWKNGVKIEGTEVVSYSPVECFWEPDSGEKTESLPAGVYSSDAVWIDSDEKMKVARDFGEDSHLGDIVYLDNPETDSSALPYRLMDRKHMGRNEGFTLLKDFQYLYIAKRETK